jgi:hypothetical protein
VCSNQSAIPTAPDPSHHQQQLEGLLEDWSSYWLGARQTTGQSWPLIYKLDHVMNRENFGKNHLVATDSAKVDILQQAAEVSDTAVFLGELTVAIRKQDDRAYQGYRDYDPDDSGREIHRDYELNNVTDLDGTMRREESSTSSDVVVMPDVDWE